jgi:large subunit ribosomal protein L23
MANILGKIFKNENEHEANNLTDVSDTKKANLAPKPPTTLKLKNDGFQATTAKIEEKKIGSNEKKYRINDYKILIRPILTEKATNTSLDNKYVFEVSCTANKLNIKKAFCNVFGKMPVKVNIVRMQGKNVRYGKTKGRTKNTKKAVITLKKGETIEAK